MISEEVRLEYETKARVELNDSIAFAKSARRELGRGNFKVALTQAMEAEKHILEAKALLRELNQLSEMDRTNAGAERGIRFEAEINKQNKKLEELEIQLAQAKKTTATQSGQPEPMNEEEEYKIKV